LQWMTAAKTGLIFYRLKLSDFC